MRIYARATLRWLVPVVVVLGLVGTASGPATAVGPVLNFVAAEISDPLGIQGLDEAVAIAMSPDGLNVYASGTGDPDGLAVFSRDPATGSLTFMEAHIDDVNGEFGLGSIQDIAVSPDGKHVYTAAVTDNAIAYFSRNLATGALTYGGRAQDGVGGVDGLSQASSVVVSTNNAHVYATGRFDDGVVAFTRNTTTGALTFIEAELGPGSDNVGGITLLNGPDDIVMSPDGAYVMVASTVADSVNVFARNVSTGVITNSVSATLTDGVNGADGLDGVTDLVVSADGKHLYTAGSSESKIGVYTRTLATGALNFVEVKTDGVGGVTTIGGVSKLAISADGENVYAGSTSEDALTTFSRSGASGTLTLVNAAVNGQNGVQALDLLRRLVVAPDGGHLYVAVGGNSDAVTVFDRSDTDGALAYQTHYTNSPPVLGLESALSVEISPDGNFVYVASAAESSYAAYARTAVTGALTFVESRSDVGVGSGGIQGLGGVRGIEVSNGGTNFYIIGQTDDSLLAILRSAANGTFQGVVTSRFDGANGVDGLDSPADVEVSPDDKHVYVASAGTDNAVTVFDRTGASGSLTFIGTLKDGQAGATGLGGANALTISNDGAFVYVAATTDNAVSAFARNATSGTLTIAQTLVDGAGGLTSLAGANDVALSPDQKQLYVTSASDNAVTVLTRDLGAGTLTYLEHETTSLGQPTEVAVSPNGQYVFVSSQAQDRLVVFERDSTTGALTIAEEIVDNANGVNGLDGAAAVQVSGDGLNLYATGMVDDALSVYSITYETIVPAVWLPLFLR